MKRLTHLLVCLVVVGAAIECSVVSGLLWWMVGSTLSKQSPQNWGLVGLRGTLEGTEHADSVVVYGTPSFVERESTRFDNIGTKVHQLRTSRVNAPDLTALLVVLQNHETKHLVVESHPLIWSDYRPTTPPMQTTYRPPSHGWTPATMVEDAGIFFALIAEWVAAVTRAPVLATKPFPRNLDQLTFHRRPPASPALEDALDQFEGTITFLHEFEGIVPSTNSQLIRAYEDHINSLRALSAARVPRAAPPPPVLDGKVVEGQWLEGLTGYATSVSTVRGEDVIVRFAGDMSLRGSRLQSVEMRSLTDAMRVTHTLPEPLEVPIARCLSAQGKGCEFPGEVRVPSKGLPTDIYDVRLVTAAGRRSERIVVHLRDQIFGGEETPVAVVLPHLTWQAYNSFGGGSFYTGSPKVMREVSLLRPLGNHISDEETANTPEAAAAIPALLERHQRPYTLIPELDLDQTGPSLARFRVLVLVVHDEYWTAQQRHTLEAYLRSGGKVLVLGGNTCWWQVDLRGPRLMVDKSNTDRFPILARRTGRVDLRVIRDPPERIFGSSYAFGGYPVQRQFPTFEAVPEPVRAMGFSREDYERSSGFTVLQAAHPIFEGLGLEEGQFVGEDLPIAQIELDGAPLSADDTIDHHKMPHAPASTMPLMGGFAATGQEIRRIAVAVDVSLPEGGRVLNLGTHGWFFAARREHPMASKIILNAYDHLTSSTHENDTQRQP